MSLPNVLTKTNFHFDNQTNVYHGKVRDVYTIGDNELIMIATDRISAFDVVLPKGIPYKGQVLNQIASKFLDSTSDIIPNWKQGVPDPMATIGFKCNPYKVEMVVRGYLTGSAWREYKKGSRVLCGVELPDGMVENQKFPSPIITPTTKAEEGHDENISREEIIAQRIVDEKEYNELEKYTLALFKRGTQIAASKGLILVDTKYEFGNLNGKIYLIDEIHTPDSSRYFYADTYDELFKQGKEQKQLSKEFVRQWLIENGFQGKEDQKIPEMSDELCIQISNRYIELYEKITGETFIKEDSVDLSNRIKNNIDKYLQS